MSWPPSSRDPGDETDGATVGYLRIPHLPLVLARIRQPEAAGQLLVIGGPLHDGLVVDATDECVALGVRIGQPLGEARACCPEAVVLPADPAADRRAHEAVLDLLDTVATAVEDDGLGRAYFAVEQLASEGGRRLLALLRTLIRARLGLAARLALAPGKFAARVAAEQDADCAAARVPVVLTSDVAGYLAPLPLEVLPLPPQARDRLRRLGIVTVGRFAGLPREGLARRFGPEAVAAHRLALGRDDRPVVARQRPAARTARHTFEPAVETAGPLVAVAEQLLERLCRALRAEGKAFRNLGIAIEYEAGGSAERTAALRAAMATPDQCRATLRALVEAAAGAGPVAALTLTLAALRPAVGEQPGLFDGAAAGTERRRRLDGAIGEVARRYPARLRRVVPRDLPTLLDEYQFALLPYEPEGEATPAPPAARPTTARQVRVVRRPGRCFLVEGGRWDELVAVHGCWWAEEWWPAAVTRIYWRVRTRSGRLCTLSRDADGWRLVEVLD